MGGLHVTGHHPQSLACHAYVVVVALIQDVGGSTRQPPRMEERGVGRHCTCSMESSIVCRGP